MSQVLNKEQLKSILFGKLHIEVDEKGYYYFRHFTKKVEDYIQTNFPDNLKKAQSMAGMFIEFETNSTFFSFDYLVSPGSSRHYFSMQTYVDGILINNIYLEELPEGDQSLSIFLDGAEHHIKVLFSGMVKMRIKNISLSDGAFIKEAHKDHKILVLGDSITQGYDCKFNEYHYLNAIAKKFNAELLNQSIGGEYFDENIFDENLPYEADTVLIALGSNDWAGRTLEELQTFPTNYMKKVKSRYPNARFIYISPIHRITTDKVRPSGLTFEEAIEVILKQVKDFEIEVINGFELVQRKQQYFSEDGIHPNDKGFVEYSKNIYEKLR